jgi:signal transduction histidine kinase
MVCEALANVAKHSPAKHATVTGHLEEGQLVVEVRDEGVGGADATPGSGLAGVADRIAAGGSVRGAGPRACDRL